MASTTPAADATGTARSVTRYQQGCVQVASSGDTAICASREYHRTGTGGWVQTTATLWAEGCHWFESPEQADITSYRVHGVRRDGSVASTLHAGGLFDLNGCVNVDRHNYRTEARCMDMTFHGMARLDRFTRDRDFRLYLMLGHCPHPPSYSPS